MVAKLRNLFLFGFILAISGTSKAQMISTYCGSVTPGYAGNGSVVSPTTGIRALISQMVTDAAGNIYFAEYGNHTVRRIDAVTNVITTIAGDNSAGFTGDGGLATAARLNSCAGIAIHPTTGNIYIGDYGNRRIRMIDIGTGIISTIAGNGVSGSTGDGGLATTAAIGEPGHICIDGLGNIYMTSYSQHRIRKINSSGIISTVMGNGTATNTGNGGLATAATISNPWVIGCDASNNVYVSNYFGGFAQIRKIDAATGVLTAFAGTGVAGFSGDGGPASTAQISGPGGIHITSGGELYMTATHGNYRVRKIDINTGIITTIAGNGTNGYSGDGGAPTSASLAYELAGIVNRGCKTFFVEGNNGYRIRMINNGPIIAASNATICAGQSFTVSPTGATSYTFQGGSAIVSPTSNATYTIAGTGANGCLSSNIATVNITVKTLPSLTANVTNVLCNGGSPGSATITASGGTAGYTYLWSSAQTTSVITNLGSGVRTVTVTDANGCSETQTVTITEPTALNLSLSASSATICAGASSTLTANATGGTGTITYTWVSGPTSNVNTVTPTSTAVYTVDVSDANNCAASSTLGVTVNALPTVSVNSGSICSGSSFTMSPSGATTYSYTGGSAIVSPTSTTNYSVTGTDANGCISAIPAVSSVTVNVCTVPCLLIDQTVAPTAQTLCSVNIATITSSSSESGVNYYLRNNNFNAIVSGPVVGTGSALNFSTGTLTTNATFNVFAESPGNNNAIALPSTNDHIRFNAPFYNYSNQITVETWVNYTAGTQPWAGQSSANTDNMIANVWLWHNGTWFVNDNGTWRSLNMPNLPIGWTHIATVADATGMKIYYNGVEVASNTTGITSGIRNNSLSIVDLGQDSRFPAGTGGRNSNVTFDEFRIWNTARSATEISTNYTLCLSGNENNLKQLTRLNEGSGTNLLSLTGSNGTLINPTTNWITGTGTCNSCSKQMTDIAAVNLASAPIIAVNDGTICAGESFTMVPSGADTYTYSNGSSVATPSANASYTVIGTSSLTGCSNTAVSGVTVNPLPVITTQPASVTVCGNGTETFTVVATNGNTYSWGWSSNNIGFTTTTGAYGETGYTTSVLTIPNLESEGWDGYYIRSVVTSSNGCSVNSTSGFITVNDLPMISVNSGSICAGQSFTMVPSGADTYTFSNGSSVATPSANATYSVSGTNTLTGCVSNVDAESNVTVNALPTISVNSGAICAGQSFTMVPTGASTYTYSNGTDVVTPSTNDSYTVTGTDANGCENNAVSSVTVNALPTISVNSGAICTGQSFTMTPSGASTYTYSNGTDVVMPTADATYSVSGTDANGCMSNVDAVASVTVNALPTVLAVTNNTLLCTGETATLTASGATTYTWSTTDNTTAIAVTPTVQTTYTVNGTDANGCVNSTTVNQDVSLCTGIVTLSNSNLSINVYPNPNNGLFVLELTTVSKVTVTNALGQVVIAETFEAGKHNLDIQNEATGVYFVKVIENNKQQTIKVIKQ